MKRGENTPYYSFPHLRLWGSKRIAYKIFLKRGLGDQAPFPWNHSLVGIVKESVSTSGQGEPTAVPQYHFVLPQHLGRSPRTSPEPWYVRPGVRSLEKMGLLLPSATPISVPLSHEARLPLFPPRETNRGGNRSRCHSLQDQRNSPSPWRIIQGQEAPIAP